MVGQFVASNHGEGDSNLASLMYCMRHVTELRRCRTGSIHQMLLKSCAENFRYSDVLEFPIICSPGTENMQCVQISEIIFGKIITFSYFVASNTIPHRTFTPFQLSNLPFPYLLLNHCLSARGMIFSIFRIRIPDFGNITCALKVSATLTYQTVQFLTCVIVKCHYSLSSVGYPI